MMIVEEKRVKKKEEESMEEGGKGNRWKGILRKMGLKEEKKPRILVIIGYLPFAGYS